MDDYRAERTLDAIARSLGLSTGIVKGTTPSGEPLVFVVGRDRNDHVCRSAAPAVTTVPAPVH
jgi:hypothetical protein